MTWETLRGSVDGNGKIIARSPSAESFIWHHGLKNYKGGGRKTNQIYACRGF